MLHFSHYSLGNKELIRQPLNHCECDTVNNNSSKPSDTLSAWQMIDIWLPKVEMRLCVSADERNVWKFKKKMYKLF